jgi:hypothetical protein
MTTDFGEVWFYTSCTINLVLLLLHYEFLSNIQIYLQTYQRAYNINYSFHKSETKLHTSSQQFLISQTGLNVEFIGCRTFRK